MIVVMVTTAMRIITLMLMVMMLIMTVAMLMIVFVMMIVMMVLVMMIVMMVLVLVVMMLLFLYIAFYFLNPCSRSSHLIKLKELGIQYLGERHIAIVAVNDLGFGLDSTQDSTDMLPLLSRHL
jgi:hypothetical protein